MSEDRAPYQAGGKAPRRKGDRVEREIVKLLPGASRVPLSGGAGGDYAGDVRWRGLTIEVKARGDGFRQLYTWLEGRDMLVVKADRRGPLVVLPLAAFVKLAEERDDDA